ncbi:MAG TPA: anti-sigma factor [Nitriliruptoraceae bacterium]|nr:anti-sigma factor [Nitriliruptoraceae bacterium]
MTSADIHSLAGAYALDALPADEVDDFEAHLAQCRACRQEVASFEATTVRLSELVEESPPASMKTDVMAMITSVRQDPPLAVSDHGDADGSDADDTVSDPTAEAASDPTADTTADTVTPTTTAAPAGAATVTGSAPQTRDATSRGMTLANRLGLGLAAALMVVAGALGLWATSLNGQLQERDDQAQQVAAVLAADGAQTIQVDGTTLVIAPDQQAVLATAGLTAPGDDEVMQVWVIDERGPVSAGLFVDPSSPKLLDVPVTDGATVGITIEPAGGSEQPTSDPIWAAEV